VDQRSREMEKRKRELKIKLNKEEINIKEGRKKDREGLERGKNKTLLTTSLFVQPFTAVVSSEKV
jgi:hypothetical protein